MKILLVFPIRSKNRTINLVPPLGLGYIATALLGKGHEVNILDCVKEGFDLASFKKYIEDYNPDVVGFTVFSSDLESVKESLNIVKGINPLIITIVGGLHPSGDPHGVLGYLPADFGFSGEGEIGIGELIDKRFANDLSDIPGLIWRVNGEIRVNDPYFEPDIDSFGFPAWDLIRPQDYNGIPNGMFSKKSPFAPIIATRGCPYPCTFCAAKKVAGKNIRKRSIKNILQEIEILKNYGIKEIHFEDDNFTYNKDFAKEVCRAIINKKYDLAFSCPNGVRLDKLDKELLTLMKQAGWYRIYVGIESGSQKVLNLMKKQLTKELIREKLKLIKESRLETAGYFILGYPGENDQDRIETIDFAKSLSLDLAHFALFIPLPGVDITKGQVYEWDKSFNTEGNLKEWQRKAFKEFHLRPKQIFYILKNLRLANLKIFLRRVRVYLK